MLMADDNPALETYRAAVMERLEVSPVRTTLGKQLLFECA